jgi:streptomycin 6-kinase
MKNIEIPQWLVETCDNEKRKNWLAGVPTAVMELIERWTLSIGPMFEREPGPSWVSPVTRQDGTSAVLKLGMPHMEAEHEIAGLRFWHGNGAVELLEADEPYNAMLLERCVPGTILRDEPEPEQDIVIAALLQRLWRVPSSPHPFRPLAQMTVNWCSETRQAKERWPDAGLVNEGLRLFDELSRPAPTDVLLATDLHAANVLRAQREPWLMIDPKPFVGDPAYDATQHLFNCRERLYGDPDGTIRRFVDLLGVDYERVRLWTFARAAIETGDFDNAAAQAFVRAIAP